MVELLVKFFLSLKFSFQKHTYAYFLFFLSWGFFGLMMNRSDLQICMLWQAGAESIVEHKTFAVGLSENPVMRDSGGGDVFYFNGAKLPAKQPGSFLWVALPYFFLRAIGLTYTSNYDLTAALATWLSVGVIAALGVSVLYLLLVNLGVMGWPQKFLPLAFAFGTTVFPFTGIPQHDLFATSFLVFVLYLLFPISSSAKLFSAHLPMDRAIGVGLLLGLIIFTSMLPALVVLGLLVFCFLQFHYKTSLKIGLAFFCGVIPLLLYNRNYFGNPLIQANVAGGFKDTLLTPSLDLMKHHLSFYFGLGWISSLKYVPLLPLGLISLVHLKWNRVFQICAIVTTLVHVLYLLNIDTVGHCQYGPRYLMPLLPFAFLGLSSLTQFQGLQGKYSGLIIFALSIYGIFVNTLGAFGSVVYCELDHFGPQLYLQRLEKFSQDLSVLWLPSTLLVIFSFCFYLFYTRFKPTR